MKTGESVRMNFKDLNKHTTNVIYSIYSEYIYGTFSKY